MSRSTPGDFRRRCSMRSERAHATRLGALLPIASLALSLLGCDSLPAPPGKPTEADRHVAPTDVVDFEALYAMHCSGCHGADGSLGPARALHDPLYQALVPTQALDRTIRAGVPGTPMPAFGYAEGGPLTDAQLMALVDGLKQRWGGKAPIDLPAYAAVHTGDAERGRAAFGTFCARCHGTDGRGGERAGSVVDAAYLGLVSDQGLRTSVIVGRPDLGKPDYRSYVPGRVMNEREIADVVAWLVSQRPRHPGQPYPATDAAKAPRAAEAGLSSAPASPAERGADAGSGPDPSAPRPPDPREHAQGHAQEREQEGRS